MNTFEDYQGIPIFEIPIYAYSKTDFRDRWKRKEARDKKALINKGYSDETAKQIVCKATEYPSIWQYNRMVGMLLLTVKTDNYLFCHLYCNLTPPRSFVYRTQLPFTNQFLINEGICLDDIENDDDLVYAIKSKIAFLQFQFGICDYYFDCSALENSISLTKILSVISQNKSKT